MSDEQDTLKRLIDTQRELLNVRRDLSERVPLAPEIEDEETELAPIPLGEPDQSE